MPESHKFGAGIDTAKEGGTQTGQGDEPVLSRLDMDPKTEIPDGL